MTDPAGAGTPPDGDLPPSPSPAPASAVVPAAVPAADEPPRPALFGLEHRAVPGLYAAGWLATLLGGGVLVISLQANVAGAAPWLFLASMVLLALGLTAAAGSQAIERGRRPSNPFRGPSPVLAFLVVVTTTFIVLIVLLGPLSRLGLDARSPLATALNLLVTTLLYAGVVRLLVVGPGALSWAEMGAVRPSPAALRDLLFGAVLAVPVLLLTVLIGSLLSRFLTPSPSPLPEAVDAAGLVLNLLTAAVLAPIGEELFFRGFTTTAWSRVYGARPAIVRGAVFFALAHVLTLADATFAEGVQRAVYSFLGLLPVALALGWVYLGRRSLYAAIGLHGAYNAIQVVLLALAGLP